MMFLILGDNDAHALFNIWRLPQLLRLCNIKVQLINFHDQNPHVQKIPMHPKKSMSHNKKSMPHQNVTKFYHNQNFWHIHTQLPNFSIAMQKKKKKKNPYMTKIKIPTSSCTKKFSHSQNHNHTNFPRINITYPTKFFHKSKFHTHKIFSVSTKFFHTHTHKILP